MVSARKWGSDLLPRIAASRTCNPVIMQMLHLTLPFSQKLLPVTRIWPLRQPSGSDACLKEALSPRLRDIYLQHYVDTRVMAFYRDSITNRVEIERLVGQGRAVELLEVDIIKDG